MCFGGGSGNWNMLMDTLKNLITTSQTKQEEALGPLTSYSINEMQKGLENFNQLKDFSSGTVAQASAPARAAVQRNLARGGMKMTDPAAQGVMGDFEASRARAYDQNMLNLLNMQNTAKQAGAQNLAAVGAARSPYPYTALFGQLLKS